MNSSYTQIMPAQNYQQLVFLYICSFNGSIGMKRLESMALTNLQHATAGTMPLITMRTIVQQAIEEYKQLRRSMPPPGMMAQPFAYQAPPYNQPAPLPAQTGYHHQQYHHAPTSSMVVSPPNSVAGGQPPPAPQSQPAPKLLTPPITPTMPDEGSSLPRRLATRIALARGSVGLPSPSRLIMRSGRVRGYMPSRSPHGPVEYPWNQRLPDHRSASPFVPPPPVYNPIGGPRGRLVRPVVPPQPAPVVRPEWATLNAGLGQIIWALVTAGNADEASGTA
ncbi:hypothetical protein MMC11_003639 [Xylographa trunciseda]|nr:hypothetical protein [Xylographa trunciseda]